MRLNRFSKGGRSARTPSLTPATRAFFEHRPLLARSPFILGAETRYTAHHLWRTPFQPNVKLTTDTPDYRETYANGVQIPASTSGTFRSSSAPLAQQSGTQVRNPEFSGSLFWARSRPRRCWASCEAERHRIRKRLSEEIKLDPRSRWPLGQCTEGELLGGLRCCGTTGVARSRRFGEM